MDSLGPYRRLRAGKVLHDNSVCACVHAYNFSSLAAVTRFSSIPVFFFLPIPTAHAHADVLYHMHGAGWLIVLSLIQSALCIVVVFHHPNPFPFWPRSYIRRTINCPLSSISSITLFFLSISRFISTIHSHFFLFYASTFFFPSRHIVWPLLSGVYLSRLTFPLQHFSCLY